MKQGKSLVELAMEIERQAKMKKDYVIPTNMLEMTSEDNKFQLQFENGEINKPNINPTCHGQLGTHTNIPTKYYNKMMEEAPQLLTSNVNHWLQKNPTKRMVRTLDNTARAFLSDRYRILDNDQVLSLSINALQSIPGGVTVASCEVTEKRLYLKCTIPSIEMEIKKGDPVRAGFIISNSEIGLGALSGQYFIERLVCLNGMIVPEYSMRKYHIGRATGNGSEGAIEYFKDDTLEADDKALMLKLRDTISTLADRAHLASVVGKLQETTEKKVEDPIHAIEEVQKRFQLNNDEKNSVLMNLIQGGDLTQYGIINAVTRTASDIESYDRATEFEKMGGDIIEMSPKDWKVMSQKVA